MGYLNDKKNFINQAVITLGGRGSRLSTISNGIPKPLIPIEGKSTLERSISVLSRDGIDNFIFLTCYKSELFENFKIFLEEKYSSSIVIFKEENPRGEAGSLIDILDKLHEQFIFLNGDIVFDMDIGRLCEFHRNNDSEITIVTHLTNHSYDSDCIIESPNGSIFDFKFKTEKSNDDSFYLGNAGMAIVNKNNIKNSLFDDKNKLISLFKDIAIKNHLKGSRVFSYNTSEYLKDMGTPKRFSEVQKDISNNVVEKFSYKKKQKVLFIDRDNTILRCLNNKYINTSKDIELLSRRIKKIALIARDYNFVLIISNQPQVSRGEISCQDVINLNGQIINLCLKESLKISGFYFCPHHPHAGFTDEIKAFKILCFCRKPMPGMFFEAAFKRNIDFKNSMMIGDSWRDEEASKSLNMKFLNITSLD